MGVSVGRGVGAGLVSVALLLGSATAARAGPRSPTEEPAPPEELQQARALFLQGNAAYQAHQYDLAIEYFTRAYAEVPNAWPGIRYSMAYNIVKARQKAYDADGDVANLRQALFLLRDWVERFEAEYDLGSVEVQEELARSRALIEELEERIADIERGDETETPQPVAPAAVEFESTFSVPPQVIESRERVAAEQRAGGLLAAGWTLGGIGGLVAIVGGGTLLGARDRPGGAAGGAGTLAVGLALLTTGGILLGVGYKKRKRVRAGDYAFAPVIGPRIAGAAFHLRF